MAVDSALALAAGRSQRRDLGVNWRSAGDIQEMLLSMPELNLLRHFASGRTAIHVVGCRAEPELMTPARATMIDSPAVAARALQVAGLDVRVLWDRIKAAVAE
jgi:hypothetical protein